MQQLDLLPLPESRRCELETKYLGRFVERLDFGKLVTYVTNKNEPVYGWFRYKEGFSRRLVETMLLDKWRLNRDSLIFDPFAGCGTTLLGAQELGFPAIGVDIIPLAVFITRAKLRQDYKLEDLEAAASNMLAAEFAPTGEQFPAVKIVNLGLSTETQEKALFYRRWIKSVEDAPTRDFLMLALLSSIEEASFTSKDGQFLRLVDRPPKPIESVLQEKLDQMISDLHRRQVMFADRLASKPRADVFLGDARSLPRSVLESAGQVSAIITSPPYLNRYDYSRTYALELCLMYDEHGNPCVENFDDLKNIRHSLLRSHIESRPAPTHSVEVSALNELLLSLRLKDLNNPRIPIMIEGYFEDMNEAIREMGKMLSPGGLVALVVANARFEGELIPVDLILSEIAESHGLSTQEKIWITRYKGNSSQQMGRYGRVPVRESIVFWKKE